jgi:hypothetical protein
MPKKSNLTEAGIAKTAVVEGVRVKNPEGIRDYYNTGWQSYLAVAKAASEIEGPNLARIVSACLAARFSGSRKQRGRFRPRIGGEPLSDRVSQASHGAYYMAVVMEALKAHMPAPTERIVEMGSGWGAIISSLWLAGAPRDAEYWALEYTDSGREVSELLAAAEPRFNLKARAFDYHDADFSLLKDVKTTLVYSIYSIEQITFIGDPLIERILAIPGFARCVHVEPVGWQVEPDAPLARLDRVVKKLGLKALDQASAAARRCRRKGKNRNLIETLRRFQKAGRIVIETIDQDLVANDPLNPGTLVVWRPA